MCSSKANLNNIIYFASLTTKYTIHWSVIGVLIQVNISHVISWQNIINLTFAYQNLCFANFQTTFPYIHHLSFGISSFSIYCICLLIWLRIDKNNVRQPKFIACRIFIGFWLIFMNSQESSIILRMKIKKKRKYKRNCFVHSSFRNSGNGNFSSHWNGNNKKPEWRVGNTWMRKKKDTNRIVHQYFFFSFPHFYQHLNCLAWYSSRCWCLLIVVYNFCFYFF